MFFHFPPSKNSTQKQYLQRDCLTFHEQQKLFVCLFFFTRKHFQKVLNLSVILFACFLLQISSAFAIIFTDCSGLSCVHVRASWYTAPFLVFFAWCRAKVCKSDSKDICTLQHRFLCFLLFLYLYFYSLSCICMLNNSLSEFPQIWKQAMKSQY